MERLKPALLLSVALLCSAGARAQTAVAPFVVDWANVINGLELNGSYGASGCVWTSTGSGTACETPSSGAAIETNGSANASQALLNFINPATFNGLTFTFSNPAGGEETFAAGGTLGNAGLTNSAITLGSTSVALGATISSAAGFNAATATALAATPSQCGSGEAANGVAANGAAQGCFTPSGGGGTGTATIGCGGAGDCGTGYAIGCRSGYVCDSRSGTIELTAGISPGNAVIAVTLPENYANNPNCTVTAVHGGGFSIESQSAFSGNPAQLNFQSDPLTASDVYDFFYTCGGA